ncbi:MAG: serine protease [Rhodobacterales bacterium]|nr:serine protease [Rhodobacterales bacterium]
MKRFVALLVVAFWVAICPQQNLAQTKDYASLFSNFDARYLTRDDKRFLQAALAFEGHYNGLLDGDWGNLSQQALNRYTREKFGTTAEDWHMAFLAASFFERFEQDGWQMEFFGPIGLSVLMPRKTLISDDPSEHFVNYRHAGSSLAISIGALTDRGAQNVHNYTESQHQSIGEPYLVRRANLAVSSATRGDGTILYTRSNYVNGVWSTIILSTNSNDSALLNAVAASISVGRAAPVTITTGGRLERAIMDTVAFLNEESDSATRQSNGQDKASNNSTRAGSGFFVSRDGYALTNAHVVDGCSKITVDGQNALLVETSADFDLALLKTDGTHGKQSAVFSARPALLNSDVTAVGYPYAGLLGGLNVTRGAVSSLKGLGGEAFTMQITAPVQTGNSGGPLIGSDGLVVGVVVSKLDVLKVLEITGDIPQNVNFAIRGEIAKLFLAQNGINPELGTSKDLLPPEELAQKAQTFTVFIECK